MAPAVGEVVFVHEALAGSKAEIGEANLMGVVAEAEAARVADAVLASMDHEAVEVLVAPAEDELQGGVEVGDGAVAPDQNPAPDQGADAA